jgi:hypothetical protein
MSEVNNPEFLLSNLSLPKPLLAAGSISAHEQYMEAIGADGMELTPVKVSRFTGRLLYRANMIEEISANPVPLIGRDYLFDQLGYAIQKDWSDEDEAFGRLVRTQHSSFRNDVNDDGLVARAVPKWRESLDQMRKIQGVTGRLAAVLYPEFEQGTVVYDDQIAPFAERTFQPTVANWYGMGLTENSSIADIKAAMDARGFTGITYDVFHCQVEKEGRRFQDPLGLAARLATAGLVRSVHLSVNRLDITGLHSELTKSTAHAKKAFVRSSAAASQTQEGEMLAVIADAWHQNGENGSSPYVALEDGPLRLGGAKRDHAAIIAHARELIAM